MLTDAEVKKILADHCRLRGAYEVAKLLAEVTQDSANEFKKVGNQAAIIHKDNAAIQVAVGVMKYSHPLRQ